MSDLNVPERHRNTTHGRSHTPIYRTWASMCNRCTNQNDPNYPRYGGRGITVCERWGSSFDNFLADMGERPEGMSIERKDNSGNYEPGNCRWATRKEQAQNTRRNVQLTFGGRTQPMVAWAAEVGITPAALRLRLQKGWTLERALSSPLRVVHQPPRT